MTRRAVIVDVVRSPFAKGRPGGALHGVHPVDLYAQVIQALLERTGIAPELVDDVITGCVLQVAEQAGNIGRQAALAAGLPVTVPAVTIDRKCGSAQQSVDFAAQAIIAGACDIVIAGGVEMMSTVPMRSNRLGRNNRGALLAARFPGLVDQGISAELIAARWNITREEMDVYSLRSHERAALAEDLNITPRMIVPVKVGNGSTTGSITADEGVRRDTSLAKLATLKPAFVLPDMLARYPQINWSVTAGNSSQVTDGAAAALIVEESVARRLGLRPRAAITHFAVIGDDPIMMLTAIIPATRKLLQKAGLAAADIGAFEVNEAFASVVLAWLRELQVDPARVNRYGGAIALGHPAGASGGRLLGNLLAALERDNLRYGIQTMCESGGMANATLIERL
jgi:acetyl-CoA acetyltransferase family protein